MTMFGCAHAGHPWDTNTNMITRYCPNLSFDSNPAFRLKPSKLKYSR